MKKFSAVILSCLALVAFMGCEQLESMSSSRVLGPGVISAEKNAVLNVRISAGGASTKATTASEGDEAAVSKIEVLVFNDNGGIDAYKASDGTGLKVEGLSSSSGSKTVVAVVNAPASANVKAVTSLEELRAITSHFKAENSVSSFVMYGEKACSLVSDATNDVTVNVDRLAARIRIDKITRKFLSTMPGLVSLGADGFEVVRVYLTNVADDVNLGACVSAAPNTTWLTDETPLSAATPVAVAIDKDPKVYSEALATGDVNKLAQDASYENIHRLYAYPNASTTQITKLMVEVKIDGKNYTYPVAFENIQPNYSYEIRNLTITRLGNPSNGDDNIDPDEPVEPIVVVDYDVDIVVNPWNLVLMGEGGDGNITI